MPEISKIQEQIHTLFVNDERHERELAEVKQQVKDCNQAILDELKDLRKEMANRLPLWATTLIACLMALLGYYAK